ncbi:MAG TPA: hypothetical protein VGH72_23245, partial [Pseudonocardia sp.]
MATTPSSRFSFFWTRAAQEAHVMPPMRSSTCSAAASGSGAATVARAAVGSGCGAAVTSRTGPA